MGFYAEPQEIERFAQEMKAKYDNIGQMIVRAQGQADAVKGRSFQGSAGTAFQNVMESYLQSAKAMNEKLYATSENVSTVAKTITNEESDNAAQIAGIDASGPQLDMKS